MVHARAMEGTHHRGGEILALDTNICHTLVHIISRVALSTNTLTFEELATYITSIGQAATHMHQSIDQSPSRP